MSSPRNLLTIVWLLTCLGALVLPGRDAQAQSRGSAPRLEDYEAIGKSQAKQAGSERNAELDALRGAVEKAVKDLIDETTFTGKQAEIKSGILRDPRRYVEEIRVVDRSEAGATVILKLRARIKLDLLRSDLVRQGILAVEAPVGTTLTRVVILPAPAKGGAPPWWAGGAPNAPDPLTYVFVDALRAKGFEVQEPRRPPPDPDLAKPPPPPEAEMGNKNVLAVARTFGVDLAIRVPWEVTAETKALDGMAYALARATLAPVEAIAVRDGSVVATVEGEGVSGERIELHRAKGAPPSEVTERITAGALRAAAEEAADRLVAALGEPIAKKGEAGSLELVVAGLDSYILFARLESVLGRELKSVRSASLRSIERGEARFEVSLQRGSDAIAFAEEVARKDFADFALTVTEKTPTRVVLRVKR